MILQIIETLRSTNSKKAKQGILEDHRTNEPFVQFLKLALDPAICFYMRKVPKVDKHEGSMLLTQAMQFALAGLHTRQHTGNAARDMTARVLEMLSERDAECFRMLLTKKIDCGISATTVNKVWPDLIPKYKVMLARSDKPAHHKSIVYPAYSQLKSDGMRCNVRVQTDSIQIFTRSGQNINVHGWFDEDFRNMCLEHNKIFDGEMVIADDEGDNVLSDGTKIMNRQAGNGILNKAIKGTITPEEAAKIRFVFWDLICCHEYSTGFSNTPYKVRFMNLKDYINNYQNNLSEDQTMPFYITESVIVNDYLEARDHYHKLYGNGEEGTILKNMDGPWENKRSKHLVKLKAELDCDLEIIGYFEGEITVKNKSTGLSEKVTEGVLGGFTCKSADGQVVVNVGSGLSHAQRFEYWENRELMIGKIVEVKYNERVKSRGRKTESLFLPRLVEVRLDKHEADFSENIV